MLGRIKLPAKNMSFWVALMLSVAAGISVLFTFYSLYLPVKVLAPRQEIRAGTVIGQNDIVFITISRRDKHDLALSDPRLVVGKYTREKLYPREPILSAKITSDQKEITGGGGSITPDETYISFKAGDARWPQGLKEGDLVAVLGVIEGGSPQILGERIKVLGISGSRAAAGQIDQLKNVVSGADGSITLGLRWIQLGPLFYGRSLSKEVWIVPEHPAKEIGGKIYDQDDLERIRKEAFNQAGPGKIDPRSPKTVPGNR